MFSVCATTTLSVCELIVEMCVVLQIDKAEGTFSMAVNDTVAMAVLAFVVSQ